MTDEVKPALKLQPELVPKPLWGISAYRLLRRGAAWKAIRESTLQGASNRCSICGAAEPRLTCHEKWHYEDKNAVATLTSSAILCPGCDSVVHLGLASTHGDLDAALARLSQMNGITREDAGEMFKQAMAVWRKRNRKRWKVTVSGGLLGTFPQLRVVAGIETQRPAVARKSPAKTTRRTTHVRTRK